MTSPSDDEQKLLEQIRDLIDGAAQEVCEENYDAPTQEPATTSRLAQAIESELKHHPINVNGLTVEVATQDVPDRNSPMERLIGGDLYVSIVWREKGINKGMLVQAKWDYKIANDPRLNEQAEHMRARTKESYVWLYERHTVASLPAGIFTGEMPLEQPVTAGQVIADGFACTRGDPTLGRDLNKPRAQAMTDMLNRLHAEAAMEFEVSKKSKKDEQTTKNRRDRG